MLYLTYNFYTVIVLKLLAAFSIGIYLDLAMKKGYLGYWVLNKFLDHSNNPSVFYTKVSVFIFCFYVTLGVLQSILLVYIDDSNTGISIIGNSICTISTSNVPESEGFVVNENISNNTANVNVQTVKISNLNIPASALNNAGTAIGNGAIVAASIKAAAKVSNSLPSVGGKLAVISSSLVLGGAAIVLKDIASNPSLLGKLSKSNFNSYTDFLSQFSSGNTTLDFLYALQILHKLQILFICFIIYYSLIKYCNNSLVQLVEKLPITFTKYVLKSINYINTAGHVYVLIFSFLALISALLTNHYFDFLLDHLDNFISIYQQSK